MAAELRLRRRSRKILHLQGRKILHYEIHQRLGSGGLGEIYAAEDLKLGRPVAIKKLPPERPVDPHRFAVETRSLQELNHPVVVKPFAIESDGVSQLLVMEPIDGTGLGYNIPEHGMTLDRFHTLASSLADGLAAAHSKNVLHLDLKPGSIVIDRKGRPRILDFGLAQPPKTATQPKDDDSAVVTEISSVVAAAPYMSPEILRGHPGDARSDVFSLGVLFYQMAGGRRPFRGTSAVEILVGILKDTPPSLQEQRPDFPPRLVEIIERCLAKDPNDRFRSAREVADALWLASSETGTETLKIPLGRFGSRRFAPRSLLVAALIVVAGLSALGYLNFKPQLETQSESRIVAVIPFESQGSAEDAYFALGMTEEIISRLVSVHELGVISRSSTESLADSGKDPVEIGRALGADYVLSGTVHWTSTPEGEQRVRVTPRLIDTQNASQIWSHSYERGLEDIFSVQNEIAVQVIDQLNVNLFPSQRQALEANPTQNLQAYQSYLRGQEQSLRLDDLEAQESAVKWLQRAVELDPNFVEGWSKLAWTHAQIYHFGLDRTDSRRQSAREAIRRALALDTTSPEARLAKANVLYWTEKDYRGALRELSLARRRAPNDSRIIEAEGFILRRLGHMEDALEKITEASRLDPISAGLKREIATTLFFMRRYREALDFYDQAITLDPASIHAGIYKARTFWALGDLKAAAETLAAMPSSNGPLAVWFQVWQLIYEGHLDQALSRVKEVDTDFFQWTTWAQPFSLLEAQILTWLDLPDQAQPLFEQALADLETRLEISLDDPRLLAAQGLALAGLGRREEALRYGRLAVEIMPLEMDAMAGSDCHLQLAEILAAVGEQAAAIDELELLLSIPSQVSVPILRVDPRWDLLRDHPRFRALVAGSDRRHAR